MALLGNPSARFPNECRLRTVITTIKLPTDDRARPSIACVRAQAAAAAAAAAGLARCDAATDALPCADAPKGLSQPLSVCACVCCTSRPSPATKYRSLSLSLVFFLCLSFSHLSSLFLTHETHSPPYTIFHTYHNVYPQHTQEKERGGGARRAARGQRRRERGGVSHAQQTTI